MHLIDLAEEEPEKFSAYSVAQIVVFCGDGKLKDDNKSSQQFRWFLTLQTPARLKEFASYCLDNKFEQSGFVLQDVVNEIGRRLGYTVTNGLYTGKTNAIGFDGIWSDGKSDLVVEIKTTDAYRINLDTVFGYGTKLNLSSSIPQIEKNCLIVVGRQDTGDLEAQVRGSRYAWNVRLISVDALVKLMFIKEDVDDPALLQKIRQTLLPIEYTRVDNIIDLVFETQKEQTLEGTESEQEIDSRIETEKPLIKFTPKAELDKKRWDCVEAFFGRNHTKPIKKTKTAFANQDDSIRVICAISKRYEGTYQPYWYALHPHWIEFMKQAKSGFLVLGCMDSMDAYAIPSEDLQNVIPKLNQTIKEDRNYWHIALHEMDGELFINLSKFGEKFPLEPYKFHLGTEVETRT